MGLFLFPLHLILQFKFGILFSSLLLLFIKIHIYSEREWDIYNIFYSLSFKSTRKGLRCIEGVSWVNKGFWVKEGSCHSLNGLKNTFECFFCEFYYNWVLIVQIRFLYIPNVRSILITWACVNYFCYKISSIRKRFSEKLIEVKKYISLFCFIYIYNRSMMTFK